MDFWPISWALGIRNCTGKDKQRAAILQFSVFSQLRSYSGTALESEPPSLCTELLLLLNPCERGGLRADHTFPRKEMIALNSQ